MKNSTWTGLAVLHPLVAVAAEAHAQPWNLTDGDPAGFPVSYAASSADAPPHEGGPTAVWRARGHGTLSVGGYMRTSLAGRRELGGFLLLTVPLDRAVVQQPVAQTADTTPDRHHDGPPSDTAPHSADRVRTPPMATWMPDLARRCVRAAWRVQGLASTDRLESMVARARTAALLPEARFRYARGWDQSYRLSPTNDDPFRLQETNAGSRWLEGRLTWRFDRVLFADDEIPIERLREQRVRQRAKVAGEVLSALFAWHRARWSALDPALSQDERLEQILREQEAAATLDVLTDGWFSAWLETGSGPVRTPRQPAP